MSGGHRWLWSAALTLCLAGLFYASFPLAGVYQAQYGLSALGCTTLLQQEYAALARVLGPPFVVLPSLAYGGFVAWRMDKHRQHGVPLWAGWFVASALLGVSIVVAMALLFGLPVSDGALVSDVC